MTTPHRHLHRLLRRLQVHHFNIHAHVARYLTPWLAETFGAPLSALASCDGETAGGGGFRVTTDARHADEAAEVSSPRSPLLGS